MPAFVLTSTGEVLEVVVSAALVVVLMGLFAAVPFAVQMFVDETHGETEESG